MLKNSVLKFKACHTPLLIEQRNKGICHVSYYKKRGEHKFYRMNAINSIIRQRELVLWVDYLHVYMATRPQQIKSWSILPLAAWHSW